MLMVAALRILESGLCWIKTKHLVQEFAKTSIVTLLKRHLIQTHVKAVLPMPSAHSLFAHQTHIKWKVWLLPFGKFS